MDKPSTPRPSASPEAAAAQIAAVIGLGNPGPAYARTRHNAGFWLVDLLADRAKVMFRSESRFRGEVARIDLAGGSLWLLKPMTFMNLSGESAQAFAAFHKFAPEQLLVVHDELDLPCGVARLKRGGGHGGHNGLRSVHQHLGESYARLRIGVGHPGEREQVLGWLTRGRPSKHEETEIGIAVVHGVDALETMMRSGWDKATQQLHTRAVVGEEGN